MHVTLLPEGSLDAAFSDKFKSLRVVGGENGEEMSPLV
jgi:hypothetical protein